MAGRAKEGEKGGTYSKDGQRSPVHAIHTFAPRIRDLAPRYGLAYCPTLSSAAAFTTRVQVALEDGRLHARDGQALQVHHIRLVRLERLQRLGIDLKDARFVWTWVRSLVAAPGVPGSAWRLRSRGPPGPA